MADTSKQNKNFKRNEERIWQSASSNTNNLTVTQREICLVDMRRHNVCSCWPYLSDARTTIKKKKLTKNIKSYFFFFSLHCYRLVTHLFHLECGSGRTSTRSYAFHVRSWTKWLKHTLSTFLSMIDCGQIQFATIDAWYMNEWMNEFGSSRYTKYTHTQNYVVEIRTEQYEFNHVRRMWDFDTP